MNALRRIALFWEGRAFLERARIILNTYLSIMQKICDNTIWLIGPNTPESITI